MDKVILNKTSSEIPSKPRFWEAMVPLYFSNTCHGTCTICSLRATNESIRRISATREAISKQFQILKNIEGVSCISLVSGELRPGVERQQALQKLSEWLLLAKEYSFEKVFINVGALTKKEAKWMREFDVFDHSLVFSIFQETYNESKYSQIFGGNGGNPKSDYHSRRMSPTNLIEAGFTSINLGVLLGLSDPEPELEAVIRHAESLRCIGAREVTLSLPRIRGVKAPRPVTDGELISLVKSVAETAPWIKIVLTTRESSSMLRELLPWIHVVSPGSSDVLPYTESGLIPNAHDTSQFVVKTFRERPSTVLMDLGVPLDQWRYFNPIHS